MSTSKPKLSVSFHNFYGRFSPRNSFFVRALRQAYDVELVTKGRDLQISSVFGEQLMPDVPGSRPLRVWWSGEARDPQSQVFDLHFGFRRATPLLGDRWIRYPLWISYIDWWDAESPFHVDRLLGPRRTTERPRFCNFIYTTTPSIRTEFLMRLSARRRVDSMGYVLNNQGGTRAKGRRGKLAVLEESMFTIAFENMLSSGYVTEKLIEPLMAGSVPIYWGAEEAKSDFNPNAFIAADGFASMSDLIRHVIEIADSPERYAELSSQPPFSDNKIPHHHTPDFFVEQITQALSGPLPSQPWEPGYWAPRRRSLGKRIEAQIRELAMALRLRRRR